MKKLPDWEDRFHLFLMRNRARPFSRGDWDCRKFTNHAVRAITGQDLIPDTLVWHDEESALKAISSYGKTLGMSVQRAAIAAGLEKADKGDARKGDVVVVKEFGKQAAGICDGFAILCPSDGGYTYKPKGLSQRVFRIP